MSHQIKISKEDIAKILGPGTNESERLGNVDGPMHPIPVSLVDGAEGPMHPIPLFSAEPSGSLTVRNITVRPDEQGGLILDLE